MEGAALQINVREQLSRGSPHCFLKVESDLLHRRLGRKHTDQTSEDCRVILLLPLHDYKHKRNLLRMIVILHEGIDCQQLLKWLAA